MQQNTSDPLPSHTEPLEKVETIEEKMSHSLSPDASPVDDDILPHAPPKPLNDAPKEESTLEPQDAIMSDGISPLEAEAKRMNLEELFDDEDSDQEFPSSAPQIKSEETLSQEPVTIKAGAKASDPEVMRAFYQRLFPFRYLFQWLNHSAEHKVTNDFKHREFAFTLQNDAYLRYQSFPTADL
ncbi:hypothetical protein AOQ84DRAFT_359191, partial [Glonium stellatum]